MPILAASQYCVLPRAASAAFTARLFASAFVMTTESTPTRKAVSTIKSDSGCIFFSQAQVSVSKRFTTTLGAVATAKQALIDRLWALMGLRKMNQAELARAVHKSESWVSGVLSGRTGIQFDVLDDLARALDVEVPDLFQERDLSSQRAHLQLGASILEEAPRDPAARASYFQNILVTYSYVSAVVVSLANAALDSGVDPSQPPAVGHGARDRPPRPSRPRVVKSPSKEKK